MRARSIKPGICDNEILGTADPFYTLLFERLWMMADREGRLEDRPLRIKAQAFPYREGIEIGAMLSWLHEKKFIRRYSIAGQSFIQILKFKDHQRPHQNEKESVIPAPPEKEEEEADTTKAASEHNQGRKPFALTPSSLTPDSGLLTADTPSASPPSPKPAERVFDHWRREWNHPGAKLDPKRRKRIEARLKDFTPDQLCDAISGYRHSPWHTGTDPKGQGVVYDGLQTLLQDTEHVEAGLRLFTHPPRPPPAQENLSPGERVAQAYRGNGNGGGRVVSEQLRSDDGDMENLGGHVWPALPS